MSACKGSRIISEGRMVVENDAGDVLCHLRIFPVFGWQLEGSPATSRELDAVEGKLKAGTFLGHGLFKKMIVCEC